MLKISVALLLIALAINASAKPWHHQARSFGNTQSGDVETNEVGDPSSTDPKSEENEINVDDDDDYNIDNEDDDEPEESDNADKETFVNKHLFENLKQELKHTTDNVFHKKIDEIFNMHPEPDFSDWNNVIEVYNNILKDVQEYMKSIGLTISNDEEEGSDSDDSSTPEPEKDSDEDEEEESPELPDPEPENSDEGSVEDSDENSESEKDSDEESDDSKKDLFKYVFQSLTQDLVNSADPEIRDEIQKIIDKHGEPDYADGDNVEELYQKILKDVKDFKKSKGIATSSEEDTSSAEGEDSAVNGTTTAKPDEEQGSDEGGVEQTDVSTEKPQEKPENGSDEESDPSDRKNLFKYVFRSLTQDLVSSADPEIRDDVQKIVNKYGEPDFSSGEEVEELYQKILKEVKAFLKSKGIATSSEEKYNSSEEGSGSIHSTTAASVEEPESNEGNGSDESGVETNDVTTEEPDEKPENESSEETDEESEENDDSKKQLFKYVFQSLTQDLVNSADPEIRDEVQNIVNKHGEPDYADGDKVEELYQKILKDVKDYKKSKGIETSSEEKNSSSEEDSSSNLGTTAAPVQRDSDEGHDSDEGSKDEDVNTEKPVEEPESGSDEGDEGSDNDTDEDDDSNDTTNRLLKYVFQSLKKDILEKADPKIHDKIREIFDKYGEPDFSNPEMVEEVYQKILKDIKEYKKSKGLPTSSEEQDRTSAEGVTVTTAAPVQTPESDEEGESAEFAIAAKPNQEQGHDSDEEDDFDEKGGSNNRKTQLYKYVFKTLKKNLLNDADPETRAKVQEIFDKNPVHDFSDGEKVEKVYKKILKDVKEYKKSKGLPTSSEEDDV